MKLISLELSNFKNIKHFILEADGEDKNIYGKNGVGKTTLADAYYWLLTDKSSLDKKLDSDIKSADPLTGNPKQDGGIEHTVKAVLELDNGRKVTLKKIYKEKWVKQNGKAEKDFSGHITSYSIDDVARNKKDFNSFICENIANTEILKLVSSTIFFNNMQWKRQREILLDVCGDITDTDVISSDERLMQLTTILKGKSINDFIDIVSARKKKINNELDKIPVRIDETTKQLDELGELSNRELLEVDLKSLHQKQENFRSMIVAINNGTELSKIRNEIDKINNKIAQIKQHYEFKDKETILQIEQEINKLKSEKEINLSYIASYKQTIKANIETLHINNIELDKLRVKYSEVFKTVFNEKEAICPTCGQVLPEQMIDDAIKNFNTNRANELKEINKKGKQIVIKNKELENQNIELEKRINDYDDKNAKICAKNSDLVKQIETVSNKSEKASSYIDDKEYKSLRNNLINLNKELDDIQNNNISKINTLKSNIAQINLKINNCMEKLALVTQADKFKKRIEELKVQQKKLGAEFELLGQQLSLTQLFITNKVHMLTNKINSKFNIARFKLFEQQINGGVTECCEAITINGAAYNSAMSNGERVKISLDICSTLSKHFGINLPIFIDNAESVTDMQDIDAQKILLIVSHHDELTVKESYKNK